MTTDNLVGRNLIVGGSFDNDTFKSNPIVGQNLIIDGSFDNNNFKAKTALRGVDILNTQKDSDEGFFSKTRDWIDSVAGEELDSFKGAAGMVIKHPIKSAIEGGTQAAQGIKSVATGGVPVDPEDLVKNIILTSTSAVKSGVATPLRFLADNNLATNEKYIKNNKYLNGLAEKTPEINERIKKNQAVIDGSKRLAGYFNKGADFVDMLMNTDDMDFLVRDKEFTEGELFSKEGYSNKRMTSSFVGQMPFMALSAGVTRLFGKPIGYFAMGAMASGDEYDQIRESDMSQTGKNLSYGGQVAGEAIFEALGFQGAKAGKGSVVDMIQARIHSGKSEGLSEVAQQIKTNFIAKIGYDAERKLSDGVVESGVLGSLTGFAMGGQRHNSTNNNLEEGRAAAIEAGVTKEDLTKYEDSVMQGLIDNSDEINEVLEEKFEETSTALTKINQTQLEAKKAEIYKQEEPLRQREAAKVTFDPKFVDIASQGTIDNMSELVQIKDRSRDKSAWTKKNTKELQTEFTDIINKLRGVPVSKKVQLLNNIKNINSIRTFETTFKKVVTQANAAMYNEVKRQNIKDIKSIMNNKNVDYEIKTQLQSFKRYNNMTKEQLENEWEILADSSDPLKNEKQRYIAMKGLGKSVNAVVTRQVYEDLHNIEFKGKAILADKFMNAKKADMELQENALKAFYKFHPIGDTLASKLYTTVADNTNKILDGLAAHYYTKMNTLFGKDMAKELSFAWENKLEDQYYNTETEQSTLEIIDALDVKMSQLRMAMSKMYTTKPITIKYKGGKRGVKQPIVSIVHHYNSMKNAETRAGYVEFLSEQSIADINGFMKLNPKYKAYAEVLMNRFPNMYNDLNAVSIKTQNRALPFWDNYFPRRSIVDKFKDSQSFNGISGYKTKATTLHDRARGNVKPKLSQNSQQAYVSYVREWAWTKSTAEKWTKSRNLFSNVELQNNIEESYGKLYLDSIHKNIEEFSINGRNNELQFFDKLAQGLRNRYVPVRILGNLGSAGKQTISLGYWAAEMPVPKFVKYMVEAMQDIPGTIAEFDKMDRFFRDRVRTGSTRYLQESLENFNKGANRFEQLAVKMGHIDPANIAQGLAYIQAAGDITGWFGGVAKYRYLVNDLKMGEVEAIKQVIIEGNHIQQTKFGGLLSELQMSEGIMSWFTMFKNAQISIANKMKNNAVETIRNERTKKQFAKDVFIFGILSDIMFYAASGLIGALKDEDEEFVDDFLMQDTSNKLAFGLLGEKFSWFPVVGDIYREAVRSATLGYSFERDLPIVSEITDTFLESYTNNIEIKPWEVTEKALELRLKLPVGRARSFVQKGLDIIF